ncbi:hypothetical protein [Pseudolysinimonas sp.]|uniref:hypothetical protein n=1 Tax=Pseudolysinimonas sp. TaxID=2680009 RepID=UPI003F7DBA50
MSSAIILRCDVPGCTSVYGDLSIYPASSLYTERRAARKRGWSETRVPSPFLTPESEPWELKTFVLDRCPAHKKVLMRLALGDRPNTYRIQIKEK